MKAGSGMLRGPGLGLRASLPPASLLSSTLLSHGDWQGGHARCALLVGEMIIDGGIDPLPQEEGCRFPTVHSAGGRKVTGWGGGRRGGRMWLAMSPGIILLETGHFGAPVHPALQKNYHLPYPFAFACCTLLPLFPNPLKSR